MKQVKEIHQYSARQTDDFCRLTNGCRGLIFTILKKYSFIKDHEKEDYCQEVIAFTWERYWKFDSSKGTFAVWFYKNAEWAILGYRKKQRLHSERIKYSDEMESWFDFADVITPDFYDESNLCILRRAINTLSEHRKKIIQMFLDGENLTQRALADGKSATAYSSTMHDIRKYILSAFGNDFEDIIPDIRKTTVIPNGRLNEQHPNSRPIEMRDMEGRFIKSFPSINEAGRHNFNPSTIVAVARGKRFSYKGYKWTYPGMPVQRGRLESGRTKVSVIQKSKNGEIIRQFGCLKECKEAGYNPDYISAYLKGKRAEYKGFIWEAGRLETAC